MNVVIYLYNGLTVLDAVGPYEVLSRLPEANVKFVAKEKGVIISDTHFLKLVAEYDIKEIQSADILVVPGSVVSFIRESKDKAAIDDFVSAMGFLVKLKNFSCERIITKILSDQTMHLPLSSENCGLFVKPKAV